MLDETQRKTGQKKILKTFDIMRLIPSRLLLLLLPLLLLSPRVLLQEGGCKRQDLIGVEPTLTCFHHMLPPFTLPHPLSLFVCLSVCLSDSLSHMQIYICTYMHICICSTLSTSFHSVSHSSTPSTFPFFFSYQFPIYLYPWLTKRYKIICRFFTCIYIFLVLFPLPPHYYYYYYYHHHLSEDFESFSESIELKLHTRVALHLHNKLSRSEHLQLSMEL